jgi:hypothetical protein
VELESRADAIDLGALRDVNLTDLFREHRPIGRDEGETVK